MKLFTLLLLFGCGLLATTLADSQPNIFNTVFSCAGQPTAARTKGGFVCSPPDDGGEFTFQFGEFGVTMAPSVVRDPYLNINYNAVCTTSPMTETKTGLVIGHTTGCLIPALFPTDPAAFGTSFVTGTYRNFTFTDPCTRGFAAAYTRNGAVLFKLPATATAYSPPYSHTGIMTQAGAIITSVGTGAFAGLHGDWRGNCLFDLTQFDPSSPTPRIGCNCIMSIKFY